MTITGGCPGYKQYAIQDDYRIEVEGEYPSWAPGSYEHKKLVEQWGVWGSEIKKASSKYDVPVPWLMGIMFVESKGNTMACSDCQSNCCGPYSELKGKACCAYGMMQIINLVTKQYGIAGPELMGNGPLAIDLAAHHISDMIRTGKMPSGMRMNSPAPYGMDFPRVASHYNTGKARCTGVGPLGLAGQNNYVYKAIQYVNTCYEVGIPVWGGASWKMILGVTLAAAGIAGGYLVWTGKHKAVLRRVGLG